MQRDKMHLATNFLFSALDPATVPVTGLFCEPVWISVADTLAAVPLVDLDPV
jgi:hypothetical protein